MSMTALEGGNILYNSEIAHHKSITHYDEGDIVCRVREDKHQLAHQCSLCEHFHAYTKCEVKI